MCQSRVCVPAPGPRRLPLRLLLFHRLLPVLVLFHRLLVALLVLVLVLVLVLLHRLLALLRLALLVVAVYHDALLPPARPRSGRRTRRLATLLAALLAAPLLTLLLVVALDDPLAPLGWSRAAVRAGGLVPRGRRVLRLLAGEARREPSVVRLVLGVVFLRRRLLARGARLSGV